MSQKASTAAVFAPRSPVKPIFLFVVVTSIFIAIAFALHNLRPPLPRAVELQPTDVEARPAPVRRSASA